MTESLPQLTNAFRAEEDFRKGTGNNYALLAFRFLPLSGTRYIATNMAGEYVVLDRSELSKLVHHQLDMKSSLYEELKSKHFVMDEDSQVAIDLLSTKLRTKYSLLHSLTSLFMFVVTLRCEHSCPYCQVSRRSKDKAAFDMSQNDALKGIELVFQSPSPHLKVEFQGGEPLLNFELIRFIVENVKSRNDAEKKQIDFVITTNLALITKEILAFCAKHNIQISTSLDGPREIHNANRPRPGGDSYERTIAGIELARDVLGENRIAALMTTTKASLNQVEAIIDEYVGLGFNSIFLRSLSPYGFAVKTGAISGYDIEAWLDFYYRGLVYILKLNELGMHFVEEYAAILLQKILTPYPTGYVDLQSPAGMGLSCLAINYDGRVYASDEARMLAEMNDDRFHLGHVQTDSLDSLLTSESFLMTLSKTMTEGMPMCSECGVQPYCGSDPTFHYTTQGDVVGLKAASSFCKKNMEIIRHLISILEDHPKQGAILRSWLH